MDTTDEQHGDETAEEFDRRMKAGLGLADDVSGERYPEVPPPDDRPYIASRVGVEPPPAWDVSETARPPSYVAARADLTAKAEAANELAERLAALPGQQAQAAAAFEAEAVAADREGRAPRVPKGRNWDLEKAVLTAQHKARRRAYDDARKAYAQVLRDCGEEWLAALNAEREPARVAALQALRDAAVAFETLRHWTATTVATARLWSELHPRTPAPPLTLAPVRAITEGVSEAVALLESDDPTVTGSWLDDTLQPPRHVRAQWADSGGGARQELLRIELAENFEHTQHCLPDALAHGLWGEVVTGPDGRRFLRQP